MKSAVLPATSLPWYSAGKANGKVLLSPDFMPRTASSNSLSIWPSPTMNWKSLGFATGKGFAVNFAFKIHGHTVAILGRRRPWHAGQRYDAACAGSLRSCRWQLRSPRQLTFSTSAVDRSAILTSGKTSKTASKAIWPSGATFTLGDAGLAGHAQLASLAAEANAWPTLSFITS
jgi:hypothetical protein